MAVLFKIKAYGPDGYFAYAREPATVGYGLERSGGQPLPCRARTSWKAIAPSHSPKQNEGPISGAASNFGFPPLPNVPGVRFLARRLWVRLRATGTTISFSAIFPGPSAPEISPWASATSRNNGPAIRAVCAQFVVLCRQLNLFTRAVIAIDGSKFKAVNNRDKNFTVAKVAKRIEQVDANIVRYLAALDRADREESDVAEARTPRIKDKIAGLRLQMQALREMQQMVKDAPDQQVSLTDPDARAMATSGRGSGMVGYNVQTAVDAEHHLIVAHEVTNQGHDRTQLQLMGLKAQEATGCEEVTALADRGYYGGEQILLCEGTGIAPVVPKTLWPGERGMFTRQDFSYDAEHDHYTCPAGAKLTKATRRADHAEDFDFYRHLSACFTCPLKPQCTPTKLRRIKSWEHEDVLDRMQARLGRMPDAMGIRRQTVEHPFGTLKAWMGSTHFLTRTLEKVRTEMSLHVLAYNMKRMIKIFGVGPLMVAIRA
jgi:hypothetical protein